MKKNNIVKMKLFILLLLILFTSAAATCMEARIEAQSNNIIGVFVPRCNEDNGELYKSLQCHGSTGFCWCVREEDGVKTSEEAFRLTDVGHLQSLCNE